MNFKLSNLAFYKLIICLLVTGLSSCKKDPDVSTTTTDKGYDYYPVALGNWYVYAVDSINHNEFTGTIDTFSYQIKELYADTFSDNEGRLSYKIERYKRDNELAQWEISDIWYSTSTESRVERVEEDVRYQPFIFPPKNETEWDLNSFNSYNIYNEWEDKTNKIEIIVKDTLVEMPFSLDSLSYDNTVTVWHKYETYISYEKYHSVYAKNVGLVYKQMVYYYSDTFSNLPIEDRVTYGVNYTQKLLSYGN